MVRLVGLTLTAVLMAFQLWYTQAPAHHRAYVPDWVRSGANVIAHVILDVSDTIGDFVGPQAKRGWDETRMQLGIIKRPEAPRRGFMAAGDDLVGQSFVAQRLDEATFLNAQIGGADFTKAFLVRAMLDGASGRSAIFDGAVLETASMRAADFSSSRFVGADLSAVHGQGANFTGAVMAGATMQRAQLSAAKMVGADLKGAKMARAVLFRTDFSGADLTGATGLTQKQLDAACGDGETKLPGELSVPPCPTALPSLR